MRWLVIGVLGALTACGSKTDSPEPSPIAKQLFTVDVPEVTDVGAAAWTEDGPIANVVPTGIVLEGTSIAPLRDGRFDPADVEGGELGMKVVKLAKFTTALLDARAQKGLPEAEIAVMIDRRLSYRTLVQTLFSMKSSGAKRFAIVARTGNDPVAVPLRLPEKKPPTKIVSGPRVPGADLQAQIDAVKAQGKTVAIGGGQRTSRLTIKSKSITPSSSLTADVMLAKVLAVYGSGIQRCAKATKPETATLAFAITETGRADKPKVTGAGPSTIDCLAGLIGNWRFPVPKAADGSATSVSGELVIEIAAALPEEPGTANATALQGSAGDAGEMAPRDPGKDLGVMMKPDDQPLQLVVSVTNKQVLLWSISGLEGTLKEPKLAYPLGGATTWKTLQDELRKIVKQRWDGRDRPPESREIIVMVSGETPMQTVAELMFAVRQTPDRVWLFPDILLSMGFE
jgi:biopolymer transport protein ExbD